ncbi:DUF5327 family protein [Staphylococcus sp. 17KM0847]|uniref:DUF5327 family protein n=1 Tax=Staphylococcus sp. 17KM0847 TaxID=2583989 RepID=UPI0015DD0A81|nr:DUF5327 family protein [Staphylococcus sp. 17KM0847]QLK85388.1 hypothetical protein FGL66_01080 [Staphylococcus sp. 17KM0847]
MQKGNLLQLLERELMQADQAVSEADFEKHIYAIHTLTALYTGASQSTVTHTQSVSSTSEVTAEEIRMMGGHVEPTQTSNHRLVTDDEIGNGESIFDF